MANYTIELRKIIESKINIFDFDYPFYNENEKEYFQDRFIKHFYFREIGSETVSRFKHYLEDKLHEIAPFYKHLYETTIYNYDPILNYSVEEQIQRSLNELNNGSVKNNVNTTNNSNNSSSQYDTPITPIANTRKTPSFIEEDTNNNTTVGSGTEERTSSNNLTENNSRTMKGNIGVMATQDLIMKEREIIININKMIFEECDELFMQIY